MRRVRSRPSRPHLFLWIFVFPFDQFRVHLLKHIGYVSGTSRVCEGSLKDRVKVKAGVGSEDMVEDMHRCPSQKVTAPLLNEFTYLLLALLKLLHHHGEENKVTNVVGHEWDGGSPLIDGA